MSQFTRNPTGKRPWPIILVDGPPFAGKSTLAYSLSASPRVGRTFVFQVGERDADKYAHLGPYEIVVLDGTWSDFIAKLEMATAQPTLAGRPNVIIIDTITRLWDDLKLWTSHRARNSEAARKRLDADPDAAIDIGMSYWDATKTRWGRMFHILQSWGGISVLIARSGEVSVVENGQPVRGETVWRIDSEKSTEYSVTANVSFRQAHAPVLVAANEAEIDVPTGGLPLGDDAPLERLVWDLLRADQSEVIESTGVSDGVRASQAKKELVSVFVRAGFSDTDAKDAAADLWVATFGVTEKGADVHRDKVTAMLAEARESVTPSAPDAAADTDTDVSELAGGEPVTGDGATHAETGDETPDGSGDEQPHSDE